MNKITSGNLMARTPITLVQGLIRLGPIEDLIWPLMSIDLSSG